MRAWLRNRRRLLVKGAVASSLVVVVVANVISGGGASPSTANLWVDPNGGPCTWSATLVEYNDATSCDSVTEAFAAASGGATIRMLSGSYFDTEFGIESGGAKSPAVTVKTETGGTVSVTGTAGVEMTNVQGLIYDGTEGSGGKGFDIHNVFNASTFVSLGWNSNPILTNFALKGVKMHDNSASGTVTTATASASGSMLFVTSCEDILIEDVELYSVGRADGIQSGGGTGANPTPGTTGGRCDGLEFNRLTMHTFIGVAPDDHQDGMQFFAGSNFVIRNSLIYGLTNAGSQEIFTNQSFGFPMDSGRATDQNLTVENTVIRHDSGGGAGVNAGAVGGVITLRNNTIEVLNTCTGADVDCNGNVVVAYSNLIEDSCTAQVTKYHTYSTEVGGGWNKNVLGGSCGWGDANYTTAGTWASMFTAPASADFTLASGSFAIDKGSTTAGQFTATDRIGTSRGSAPDAGAYERP